MVPWRPAADDWRSIPEKIKLTCGVKQYLFVIKYIFGRVDSYINIGRGHCAVLAVPSIDVDLHNSYRHIAE
jgi:hypothetical protein